ncbi:MAG: hypothetical protein J7J72_03965 [Bacteroidales bacterium]|nr:hypothetical protein [Bacteroidales bacterium]
MQIDTLSSVRKALILNLDSTVYGTFAEIGAGQEVARTFFQAGGASGTVAKTISAYDMEMSDALYGKEPSSRYVSKNRLLKMLKQEATELTKTLGKSIRKGTRFFVFADTVTTINFAKDKKGHGWMGVRFQIDPKGEANEVILHVRLLENTAIQQQETYGVLGTNLLYACFNHYKRPNLFLQSLMDSLLPDQLEITMIEMSGPELNYVDNRLLGVQLVKNGMAKAIIFDHSGKVQTPEEMLYKKNVLAFRGSFRPITYVGLDMIESSYSLFKRDADYDKSNTLALCEITLNNLLSEGEFSEQDFLDRVDILNGIGQNVMVSNYREYYKLVSYFSQFQIKNLRIVIGVLTLKKVLDKSYYSHLKGGVLEAFGKLFTDNMKLYVYPALQKDLENLMDSTSIPRSHDLNFIYNYLIQNRKIIDIKEVNKERLHIFSSQVLKLIHEKNPEWETMVPDYVSEQIKQKNLFGYQPVKK